MFQASPLVFPPSQVKDHWTPVFLSWSKFHCKALSGGFLEPLPRQQMDHPRRRDVCLFSGVAGDQTEVPQVSFMAADLPVLVS